jgi:hypothetical protein
MPDIDRRTSLAAVATALRRAAAEGALVLFSRVDRARERFTRTARVSLQQLDAVSQRWSSEVLAARDRTLEPSRPRRSQAP